MILAVDVESTGLNLYHGCRPYCVTTCSDDGTVRWWEWPVDPHTREVFYSPDDLAEIEELLRSADTLVGQNAKFDVGMLLEVGMFADGWPWNRTEDTLIAAHLLASNAPHDLTALATDWLGKDIKPVEDRLKEACSVGRRRVQQARLARKRGKPKPPTEDALADWRIAEAGLPEMPSAGKEPWKADGWLPRALAQYDNAPEPDPACNHLWPDDGAPCMRCNGDRRYIVLAEYANTDSETTLRVWLEQSKEISRRGS